MVSWAVPLGLILQGHAYFYLFFFLRKLHLCAVYEVLGMPVTSRSWAPVVP